MQFGTAASCLRAIWACLLYNPALVENRNQILPQPSFLLAGEPVSGAVATQAFYLPPSGCYSISRAGSPRPNTVLPTQPHVSSEKNLQRDSSAYQSLPLQGRQHFCCNLSLLTSPEILVLTLLLEDGGGPRIFDPNAICDTSRVLLLRILPCPLLTKLPKLRTVKKMLQYLERLNIHTFFKSTEIKEL